MSKSVLVIGGTRFFGRLLVRRLVERGDRVTIATRGLANDPFGEAVERVRVDRRDPSAMAESFSARAFDLVFDQMCYTPIDARISTRTFAGRVGRYVMTSTIEVYDEVRERLTRPLSEADLSLGDEPIEMEFPWEDPTAAESRYGAGKRQAEAWFAADATLPVVAVRVGHVLAGPEDFTGRLAHYVDAALAGQPLSHSAGDGKSAFIDGPGIADFLTWVGGQSFLGAVNAAAGGSLSAVDIFRRAGAVAGVPVTLEGVDGPAQPNALSPFDYPHDFLLDTRRGATLGYRFGRTRDWLDDLIRAHLAAPARV